MGILIGISQGHRPGHLSKPCAWTLPYKPRPDDKGEYREAIPRLIQKVERTFTDGFSHMEEMKIIKGDARKLKVDTNLSIISFQVHPTTILLDYVGSSRLRLAITGYYDEEEKKALKETLIQKFNTYLDEMEKCIEEMHRVLKKTVTLY